LNSSYSKPKTVSHAPYCIWGSAFFVWEETLMKVMIQTE
jgi:hypothetical protein